MVDILIASAYIRHNLVSHHPPFQDLLYSATVVMAQYIDRYPNGSAFFFFYKLMREMRERKGAFDTISYRFTFFAYWFCKRKVIKVI